jgi:hypothetical protein
MTNISSALCIICEDNQAKYCIKGQTTTCYCKECALIHFADLKLLDKL